MGSYIMPTVKTRVDAKTYRSLVKMRKAAGLPNVSALFLHKCDLLTDDGEAAEIVRTALQRAKRKSDDDDYRLRDLFSKKTWEQFSKGARLRAGRMFQQKIAAALDGIRATRKNATNHQFYQTAARQ
jgi:Domain of unknown function (DUF1413)